jgi:molybdopterin-guanine dinucleotide biosynthesis protein A
VAGAAREAGCEALIVAGDVGTEGAITVREQPAFGGPLAGIAAALPRVETEWILLLACDLPHARPLCRLLCESFREAEPGIDGLVAIREDRVQWLAGLYRRDSIEAALGRFGDPDGVSMHAVFGGLTLRQVQDPDGLSRDIDTPQDLEAFTIRGEEEA